MKLVSGNLRKQGIQRQISRIVALAGVAICVLAGSPADARRSSTHAVSAPKAAPAAQQSAEPADQVVKDKWALIIGISKYKDSSINLRLPAKDARDFNDFLIKEGNFAPDHTKLLINEEATRENILSALGDKWLPHAAGPGDLVVIYISAHGSPSEIDVGGVNYVVAYDTSKDSLFSTGIPMQDLIRTIKARVHSERIVLILDACHSGAATPDGKGLFKGGNVDVDKIAAGTGQLVISSSMPDQVSWESRQQLNSVFTRHLIDGLRHDAAKPKNVNEAFNYLKEKVEQEVLSDRGTMQTPVMRSKWSGNALDILSRPTSPRTAPADVVFKPAETTPVARPSVVAALPAVTDAPKVVRPAPAPVQEKKPVPQATATATTLWTTYMEAGRQEVAQGHHSEACTVYANAIKEAKRFADTDLRKLETLQEGADEFIMAGRLSEAEPLLWQAVRYAEATQSESKTVNKLAPLFVRLANIQMLSGKAAEAKKLADEAMLSRNGAAPDKKSLAQALDIIAMASLALGKPGDGEFYLGMALRLREQDDQAKESDLYKNHLTLAKTELTLEKYGEAELHITKALDMAEKMNMQGAEKAECLETYAGILKAQGKTAEAHKIEYKARNLRSKLKER